jgi:hypothetical protein
LAVFETLGERIWQSCGPDSGGSTGDVVLDPPVNRLQSTSIELQPRRAGVAVTRLADAARIHQPFAPLERDLLPVRSGLAGGRSPILAAERKCDMRVADEANAVLLDV